MAVVIENLILNSPFAEHAERFASGRSGSANRLAVVPSHQARPTDRLTA